MFLSVKIWSHSSCQRLVTSLSITFHEASVTSWQGLGFETRFHDKFAGCTGLVRVISVAGGTSSLWYGAVGFQTRFDERFACCTGLIRVISVSGGTSSL
ncbi:hypothetical protein AVEN_225725-1 [Araneus ventricosus]|uniref:Uncharacterized protein n=1 Tax=Araneus ventricosus TaxID=182803 RepID=A0A4Y2PE76_ARAVE|nr:hypothetical protein AVEN_225725-1 [Araneus ventricosus]